MDDMAAIMAEVEGSRQNLEESIDAKEFDEAEGPIGAQQEVPLPKEPEVTVDYAGFKSLDELVNDYKSKKTEAEQLSSLKGRMGNEVGELRAEKERLLNLLEKIQAAQPVKPTPDPSTEDLIRRHELGEMSTSQFIAEYSAMTERKLSDRFQTQLKEAETKAETAKRIEKFLTDNPGYREAFEAGHLKEDLEAGLTGEWAWDRHNLKKAKDEINSLKTQIADFTEKARKQGFELGVKVEQGKELAGKVLTEKGGVSFSEGKASPPQDRLSAAIDLIKRKRASG